MYGEIQRHSFFKTNIKKKTKLNTGTLQVCETAVEETDTQQN